MSLNFPNSPANGENFVAPNGVTYRWDGEKWVGSIPPSSSPWLESNGVVSLNNSGSTVGVGTSSTSGRKLEVAGNLGVIGGGNLLLQNGARVQYGTSDAASIIGQDGSNGYLVFGVNNERARITSSGNLGINTSTPPAKLTVTGGNSSSTAYAGRSLNYGALVHTTSGRSGYIVQNTNAFTSANDNAGFQWLYPFDSGGDSNYKVFRSAAGTTLADKFWVNQGGGAYFANSVGIGTTSAARPLHISSNLNNPVRIQSSAGYSRIEFEASGTTSPANVSIGAQNNDFRVFTGSGTGRLIVKDTGFVGVGTTSPTTNFEVVSSLAEIKARSTGASNPSRLQLDNVAGATLSGGQIVGQWDGSPVARIDFRNGSDATNRDNGEITFHTSDSNNLATEKLRITSNGKIGQGTSAPLGFLHLRQTSVTSAPSRNSCLYLENNSNCEIQFVGDSTSDCQLRFGTSNNSFKGAIEYDLNTDKLNFYTNGSNRMSVSNTGTVAITGSLTVNGQAVATGNIAEAPTDGQQYARQNSAWSVVNSSSSSGGYVNVKDFGAVGNGTTDDTTAVRSALNGGGTVYFPAGTYRITSTLSHTSAFNVVGDGQQSRIMYDASSNNTSLFNLETNVRHNNAKKWSFSSIALSCKAVTNRIHGAGIRIAYTGAATVIGGTNYLELNDVHIVSEITTDATQAYFRYGLRTVNIGGIVADNLNISTFNANAESNAITQGIRIENSLSGHAVIRAFTGNNIYIQRYYKGLYATKAGGGQNIESIYMTQGEIVCHIGIHLEASHATFISGMHIECKEEAYFNTSDGGPHRVVGCDLRGGRNGTLNLTNYLIKIGVDNCSLTGNYITAQMPSAGCIRTGGPLGSPDNVSIVGNIFNGNGSSTYRALSCESGSSNVIFTGNLGSGFGGNSNPVFNQIGTGQGKLNNTTNEFL